MFYDRPLSRIYDLKGSERNRFNEAAAANPQVRVNVITSSVPFSPVITPAALIGSSFNCINNVLHTMF